MKNKVVTMFILAIVICVFFCACGEGGKKPAMEAPPPDPDWIMENEQNVSNEYVVEITESTEPQEVRVSLIKANAFSEGIAWVRFLDTSNGYKESVGLLKSDGEIISNEVLNSCSQFGSDFSGGYSYVNNDGGFFIINDVGDVSYSIQKDENSAYRVLAGGDGVFFVYQTIRSMTENEDRYGFVDAKGNWIVELTTANPLGLGYKHKNVVYHGYDLLYYYLGEHVFLAQMKHNTDSYFNYYNVDTGAIEEWTDSDNPHFVDADGNPFMYSNGLVFGWDDGVVFSMDTTGNMVFEQELVEKSWGTKAFNSDGIFFTGIVGFNGTSIIKDGMFYDLNGNVLIDFSDYTVIVSDSNGFYEFHDGVAAVKILGADGERYISHIDLNGQFLYEPIKFGYSSNLLGHGSAEGGTLYIKDSRTGQNMILKPDGTMNPMPEGVKLWDEYTTAKELGFVFSDGYAWCDSISCFVDEDGQLLDTYIMPE